MAHPRCDLVDHATGLEQQIIEVVESLERAERLGDAERCAALSRELTALQNELAETAEAVAIGRSAA